MIAADRRPALLVKNLDFCSARHWHSIGTDCVIYRPQGFETI
jgi:hypothetical protein